MLLRLRKRTVFVVLRVFIAVAAAWSTIEIIRVRQNLIQRPGVQARPLNGQKVFVASIHWNNEAILRSHWNAAVVDLANNIGRDNVYVSIQESGSWDDTKGALRDLDARLEDGGINRRIILNATTHADVISMPPAETGWIETPRGRKEVRRVPYLAELRNIAMRPLYELRDAGVTFDKVLFLNDVVFTTDDVQNLLATRDGDYAAACSLDFARPPHFYDTFALRDSEGHEALMQTWPYFRARASRQALKSGQPVPVTSCWNGVVAMDTAPFYHARELGFRGIPDSLASLHLEGSECCLIHADNAALDTRGVWLNSNVRVGYNGAAYDAVNPRTGISWISALQVLRGSWENRVLRWMTTVWFKELMVFRRLDSWRKQSSGRRETGGFCLINEMQVLVSNGWAHM